MVGGLLLNNSPLTQEALRYKYGRGAATPQLTAHTRGSQVLIGRGAAAPQIATRTHSRGSQVKK
jgi:hypothetical protein